MFIKTTSLHQGALALAIAAHDESARLAMKLAAHHLREAQRLDRALTTPKQERKNGHQKR